MSVNKPGRNEPCLCGSGEKYKKCCITKDAASAVPQGVSGYAAYVKQAGHSRQAVRQADEPERYIGYSTPAEPGESPFDHSVVGLKCMVTNITTKSRKEAQVVAARPLPLGSWIVTNRVPGRATVSIAGPYATMQEAFDFARATFSVVRFKAMHL